jgi:hypothetical protein
MSTRFDDRDSDLGGYWARDTHRGGFGDQYARERPVRFPKNYMRSDERIAEEIHQRLTEDDDLDATHIDVHVENGEVTLTGAVSSRWAKRHAEDVVLNCLCVHDVQNRLTVEDRTSEKRANSQSSIDAELTGRTVPRSTTRVRLLDERNGLISHDDRGR